MLVLLPPSEGKLSGGDGPPVDLALLSWSEQLTDLRTRVGTTLADLARRHPVRARQLLGLSESLDGDRAADAELWSSATMPAGLRYAGVLYDALGYGTLPAPARRRADAALVVLSGLWGASRPRDRLPAYRIGIGTRLPGIGGLPAFWREALMAALDNDVSRLGAIDLRSTGYREMYRPSPTAARRLVAVAVVTAGTTRAAPSYASKAAKGAVVAGMLRTGAPSVARLGDAAATIGLRLQTSGRAPVSARLEVPPGWVPRNL